MNLGSPDAPEPPALKRYLRQFLSDPRVLEIPALLRKALLELIILPRRSKTSAELSRSVWTKVGSPLIAICRTQARLIGEELGSAYHVELAMRYGNPSIEAAVARLEEAEQPEDAPRRVVGLIAQGIQQHPLARQAVLRFGGGPRLERAVQLQEPETEPEPVVDRLADGAGVDGDIGVRLGQPLQSGDDLELRAAVGGLA